jgi:20S proteasome alpha/beta subunit
VPKQADAQEQAARVAAGECAITTIACKSGIIAYDSRCCAGSKVHTERFQKHRHRSRVHFFFTGSTGDIEAFIGMYFGEKAKPTSHCEALVWDGRTKKLLSIGWDGKSFFTNEESLDEPCAFGTGQDHALTAMDCGLSAKEAVKMAAKRDTGTNSNVRTYTIRGYGK